MPCRLTGEVLRRASSVRSGVQSFQLTLLFGIQPSIGSGCLEQLCRLHPRGFGRPDGQSPEQPALPRRVPALSRRLDWRPPRPSWPGPQTELPACIAVLGTPLSYLSHFPLLFVSLRQEEPSRASQGGCGSGAALVCAPTESGSRCGPGRLLDLQVRSLRPKEKHKPIQHRRCVCLLGLLLPQKRGFLTNSWLREAVRVPLFLLPCCSVSR